MACKTGAQRRFDEVKPTGNKISVSARVIDRIKDGKVVEHWANRDDLSHLQQIGLIPPAS